MKTIWTHTISDNWSRVRQRETAVRFHAKADNRNTEEVDTETKQCPTLPQTYQSWYRYNSSYRTGCRRERAPLTDPRQRRTWQKSSLPFSSPCGSFAPRWPDSPSKAETERWLKGERCALLRSINVTRITHLESENKLDSVCKRCRARKTKILDQSEEKEVEKRPGQTQCRSEPCRQRHKTRVLWGEWQTCSLAFPMN